MNWLSFLLLILTIPLVGTGSTSTVAEAVVQIGEPNEPIKVDVTFKRLDSSQKQLALSSLGLFEKRGDINFQSDTKGTLHGWFEDRYEVDELLIGTILDGGDYTSTCSILVPSFLNQSNESPGEYTFGMRPINEFLSKSIESSNSIEYAKISSLIIKLDDGYTILSKDKSWTIVSHNQLSTNPTSLSEMAYVTIRKEQSTGAIINEILPEFILFFLSASFITVLLRRASTSKARLFIIVVAFVIFVLIGLVLITFMDFGFSLNALLEGKAYRSLSIAFGILFGLTIPERHLPGFIELIKEAK